MSSFANAGELKEEANTTANAIAKIRVLINTFFMSLKFKNLKIVVTKFDGSQSLKAGIEGMWKQQVGEQVFQMARNRL